MKTLTTIFAACLSLLGAVVTSYAQTGQLQFENNSSQTPITFDGVAGTTYASDAGQRVWGPAGTFEYGLYLGPAGSTDFSQLTLVDTYLNYASTSSTSLGAGIVSGGTITGTGNANSSFEIQAGITYADEVVGWTAADGSTFPQALASGDPNLLVGFSNIGSINPLGPPYPPSQVFGTAAGEVGGFTIGQDYFTPEPGTITLSSLGAAALLLFRRRK